MQPPQLLLHIPLIRPRLLRHLPVILPILLLHRRGRALKPLHRALAALPQRREHLIQRWNGSRKGVEPAAREPVRAGLFVDKFEEVVFGAAALVWHGVRGAFRVVEDGGVGFHSRRLRRGFGIFGFAVNLGYEDARFVGEVRGQFFPGRGEGFAI